MSSDFTGVKLAKSLNRAVKDIGPGLDKLHGVTPNVAEIVVSAADGPMPGLALPR